MPTVPERLSLTPETGPEQAVAGYRLLRLLGKGGMSEVYLGYDSKAGQPVAVKVLSESLAHDNTQIDRFKREAAITQSVNHSNVVRGLASGRDPGSRRHYLVLEYIDGPSAQTLLDRQRRLAINDAAHIALGVARGLSHLHARKYIHRDIKPDNILLSPSGEPKVIDLGLVKWEKKSDEPLTATNDGFGTSYYMPYEQSLNAHFVDARSDIFALGATLYHLLAGRVPFPGDDHREVMRMKQAGIYTPLSMLNPEVPAEFEAIINRMLAADPTQRYRTAADVIVALQRAQLVSGLPSYADLGLAVRDPKKPDNEQSAPTRPDLRLRSSKLPQADSQTWWVLRYKNKQGAWKLRRATTEQILKSLQSGRFPGPVYASRSRDHRFRSLQDFPEFHVYFAHPDHRPIPASSNGPAPGFCRRVLARLGLI